MPKIAKLVGREILDSRGKPTVLATCTLEGGISRVGLGPIGSVDWNSGSFRTEGWRCQAL